MRIARPTLLSALLALLCATPALAQALPSISLPSSGPALVLNGPPIRQDGLYMTAPITLDGNILFRVAVPIGTDPGSALMLAAQRQATIEAVFAQLTSGVSKGMQVVTNYAPSTLALSINTQGNEDVIDVADHDHSPMPILTVTTADAKYQKTTVAALAQRWMTEVLQPRLLVALEKRQPAEVKHNSNAVGMVALGLVIGTVLLLLLHAALGRRMIEYHATRSETDEPSQRLSTLRAIRGISIWVGLFLWVGAIMWALTLFPQLIPSGQLVVHRIRMLILIWLGCGIADRVLEVVILRIARVYTRQPLERTVESARLALRAPTVARAANGFKTFALIFIAVLSSLGQIGISTGSVITISGVAALAITFSAQNLVRDFLNGCLVLLEDQYAVGDYIQINEWSGIVEHLTLRIVQVRDGRGNLITIPHSSAIQVVNSSRNWSRVDYRIAVAPTANLEKALATLRSTIELLARDQAWRGAILEAVEWCGIEAVSQNGVVLRASIRTAPLRQFEVRRAINVRIIDALTEAEVPLGSDPGTVVVSTPVGSPDPT